MGYSISDVIREIRNQLKESDILDEKKVLSLFADLSPNMIKEKNG